LRTAGAGLLRAALGRNMKAEGTKMPERMRQLSEQMMAMAREIMAMPITEENEDFRNEVASQMDGAHQELHRLASVVEQEQRNR
jgi:hypothetical protein